jgi:nitroimidazol reductase NimA-like FMN-containing flavoprotein (pyridoxamine 5'-phosphate oxidase superfamily)/GNAT superfamily N-acetyltransferase
MRKEIFRMDRADAVALLGRAPFVHVASTTPDGEPVLRAVHAVVVGDRLLFHGAPAGEKMDVIGRRAIASAEEVVASIPSYFVDPERACPATTFYRSAQAHGTIERVEDAALKAAMLAALMAKHQPEGGHAPIDAESALYRKAIAGVLVLAVPLDSVDGKAKLGQNRTPEEITRILGLLWARGAPGDAAAIELIRAKNRGAPARVFLDAPVGATLACAMGEADAEEAAEMLVGAYWNVGIDRGKIRAGLLGSQAWVGARDRSGALVATARAISDGAKRAWIYDVLVAPAWRRRGLGQVIMKLLLDHPALRRVWTVLLNTRDADGFYEAFGFRARLVRTLRGERNAEMILERAEAPRGEEKREPASPLASASK